MSDQWETFCDVGYYHMWRLRRENERGWNDGFHINTRTEAQELCKLLNKLEREVAEAKEQRDKDHAKIENQAERIKYLEGTTNYATGTPLSKMREQRDRLAEALRPFSRMMGGHTFLGYDLVKKATESLQSLTTNEL